VSLSPVSNLSDFYPSNAAIDEDGTHSERFEDKTSDSSPPGCQGPGGNANGDEDLCERIFQVKVTPDTSHPGEYTIIHCDNGECAIRLEK